MENKQTNGSSITVDELYQERTKAYHRGLRMGMLVGAAVFVLIKAVIICLK